MGPKTEEEMAIELFDAFQRLVSAVERIANILDSSQRPIGPDYSLTAAKEMQKEIYAHATNAVHRPEPAPDLHP